MSLKDVLYTAFLELYFLTHTVFICAIFDPPFFVSYAQELPSRCKKEIIQAANVNENNCIEEEDLVQILYNIGAQDAVSKNDLRSIILELGDKKDHTISVTQLIVIL